MDNVKTYTPEIDGYTEEEHEAMLDEQAAERAQAHD